MIIRDGTLTHGIKALCPFRVETCVIVSTDFTASCMTTKMPFQTVIGQKLELAIQQELRRMDNDWFFKWNFIGKDGHVEIESFPGAPIRFGGIAYVGSPVTVFWDTISRYRKVKVSDFFGSVEDNLPKYPKYIRSLAISEASAIIQMFAASIQRKAVEKDRVLRGDGITFPPPRDLGCWEQSDAESIGIRADALTESYCELDLQQGGTYVIEKMMTEKLTFLKADGSGQKDGVKGLVTSGKVITFDTSLPVQPNDRFLRELPSGLVEEYIVEDPGFQGGIQGAIKPHYQARVHRTDARPAPANQIINNIQGPNARININSTDNSHNVNVQDQRTQVYNELRERLGTISADAETIDALRESINRMEAAHGSPTFLGRYQEFMATAANHMAVFAPLLPALAGFLGGN